jgi:hypothetical protein
MWQFAVTWELTAEGRVIHQANGYSTGNYLLLVKEFYGDMVIPPGTTFLWQGIHQKNGYADGNYQLMTKESIPEE